MAEVKHQSTNFVEDSSGWRLTKDGTDKPYDTYHDTEAWRRHRDAKLMDWIGERSAVDLIIMIGDVCEIIDDFWDRDKDVSKERLQRLTFNVLVDIPLNNFMVMNRHIIGTIMNHAIHMWLDSCELEKEPTDHDLNRAYMLRNMYGRIVHTVIEICKGRDYLRKVSPELTEFFLPETLEEYKAKFIGDIIAENKSDGDET